MGANFSRINVNVGQHIHPAGLQVSPELFTNGARSPNEHAFIPRQRPHREVVRLAAQKLPLAVARIGS